MRGEVSAAHGDFEEAMSEYHNFVYGFEGLGES